MLFSTSNESGMKLQVVSNFNLVNNEATSCFRAQISQKTKLQVDSNFKQPKMKLQVVLKFKRFWNEATSFSNFNLVNNEATSCFHAQTSQE